MRCYYKHGSRYYTLKIFSRCFKTSKAALSLHPFLCVLSSVEKPEIFIFCILLTDCNTINIGANEWLLYNNYYSGHIHVCIYIYIYIYIKHASPIPMNKTLYSCDCYLNFTLNLLLQENCVRFLISRPVLTQKQY